MQITTTRATALKPKPEDSDLTFGTIFTDHMFNMDYIPEKKWYNPRIHIGDGKAGSMAQKFFDTLMDMQYGKTEDSMGWIEKL
ncbi:MAG: hypothetical protein KKF30_17175 [Proteobacteria bacterium]|nr:hypothetical protein [Pseudomonadota bacterium]MBU4469112.1 hypothetical protein [Pseudomonadota bacterium]MCG2752143.1 hypothetical protein [Desulfobacteraceae bacterium]